MLLKKNNLILLIFQINGASMPTLINHYIMNPENRFAVLIADDEPLARERMLSILETLKSEYPIGEIILAQDGQEAFTKITERESKTPLLALLDIHMPNMTGLEVASHVVKMRKPPLIVFVTAHEEHAVEAFESQAFDYILKPLRRERLVEVFDKMDRLALLHDQLSNRQNLNEVGLKKRQHLSVSERGKVRLIPIEDILFLKAELKYTTIKTSDREYLTEEPLTSLFEEFSEHFIRIHRNCLIAKNRLRGFERNRGEESGWLAILDGHSEKLPVSRRQWTQIRELKL